MTGQGGHKALLWAASCAVWGFDLGEQAGLSLLLEHFNPRCLPPWPEGDVRRKCAEAAKGQINKPRGWLLDADGGWEPPANPVRPGSPAAVLGNLGSATPDPDLPHGPLGLGLPDEEPAAAPQPGAPQGQTPNRSAGPTVLSNFREVTTDDGARRLPLTPQQILGDVLRLTGGWPKAAGGRLFAPGGESGRPLWLDDVTTFFGWLQGRVGQGGGELHWGREPSHITKGEFLSWLATAVPDRFDAVECHPHEPPVKGVYYLHEPLPAGGVGAFDDLLEFFNPATDTDRHLLRAMFLTTVWGGAPGKRPLFVIEAADTHEGKPGQAAGKSTVAETVGDLVGGYISLSLATTDEIQVQGRMLSKEGRAKRVVIFDNVKGSKVSSSLVEGYVTNRTISGKEMYVGEGSRSNYITWVLTANSPSLSHDFATRAYVIRLNKPHYSPNWTDQLAAYIAAHGPQILADMTAELRTPIPPGRELQEYSRWPNWDRQVLARVCDPAAVLADTGDRRDSLNADKDAAALVREKLVDFIRGQRIGLDPERAYLTLSPAEIVIAIGDLCPGARNVVGVGKWLTTLTVPGLSKGRTTKSRFWVWRGDEADATEPVPLSAVPN